MLRSLLLGGCGEFSCPVAKGSEYFHQLRAPSSSPHLSSSMMALHRGERLSWVPLKEGLRQRRGCRRCVWEAVTEARVKGQGEGGMAGS